MSAVLILLFLGVGFALENLGVHGHIYKIEERSILEEIKEKASRISLPDIEKAIRRSAEMIYLKIDTKERSRKSEEENYVDPAISN